MVAKIFHGSPTINQNKVVAATLAGMAAVYAFWEIRVQAGKRLGKTPLSVNKEWESATTQMLQKWEQKEGAPGTFVFMNPMRHNIPASRTVMRE